MTRVIDYYFAPHSPWTYLGHERFVTLLRDSGAQVRLWPVDLLAVFDVSGGLPLPRRPPQRQAYRLLELRRFSRHLALPMNVEPRFFPVAPHQAARLIIAVDQADGTEAALRLTGAALRAVWAEERDLADDDTLAALLREQALPAERLDESRAEAIAERYAANTRQAIDAHLFGAPSYVLDGELFWGQDRLDFLRRALLPDDQA